MLSATPQLQLDTLFVLSESGRILSTRQPLPSPGPAFMLIRGATEVAWAVRDDVADELTDELADLARQEPPSPEWQQPPIHARRYQAALRGRVDWGPAFEFPEFVPSRDGVVAIHEEALLGRHFSGWVAGEIEAGAAPMMAVLVDGDAVSVCFCARRSIGAAEAGLETAPAFRGRGLAARIHDGMGPRRPSDRPHAAVQYLLGQHVVVGHGAEARAEGIRDELEHRGVIRPAAGDVVGGLKRVDSSAADRRTRASADAAYQK